MKTKNENNEFIRLIRERMKQKKSAIKRWQNYWDSNQDKLFLINYSTIHLKGWS